MTKVLSILAHKKRMPHYAVREVGLRAPSIVIRACERTNRMIEERTGRLAVARFIAPPILFGWEDVDGDGVPEILDSTPYGRASR